MAAMLLFKRGEVEVPPLPPKPGAASIAPSARPPMETLLEIIDLVFKRTSKLCFITALHKFLNPGKFHLGIAFISGAKTSVIPIFKRISCPESFHDVSRDYFSDVSPKPIMHPPSKLAVSCVAAIAETRTINSHIVTLFSLIWSHSVTRISYS